MRSRVLAIVSRRVLLHSKFSTVICAPVYSARHGISTRVEIGVDEVMYKPVNVKKLLEVIARLV